MPYTGRIHNKLARTIDTQCGLNRGIREGSGLKRTETETRAGQDERLTVVAAFEVSEPIGTRRWILPGKPIADAGEKEN